MAGVSDAALRLRAKRAGILVDWIDAAGARRRVAPEVLRRVLEIVGEPSGAPAPLVTAEAGKPVLLPQAEAGAAELVTEDGTAQPVELTVRRGGAFVEAPDHPGHYRLRWRDRELGLAVAPRRCLEVPPRSWGVATQIHSLRRAGDGGIGDMGGVAQLAVAAARQGADAVAVSPMHALFTADLSRWSPYAPSSRLFLNPLLADPSPVLGPQPDAGEGSSDLVDWPRAGRAKLERLRALFERPLPGPLAADLESFRTARGALLEEHARFEALHAVHGGDWRDWPAALRDPGGAPVREFAAAHATDVRFHIFLQWLAERSLAAAQRAARDAGMRVGLIADLAVGMDRAGSHAWSHQRDVLGGLSVGAPPDLFNQRGQDWGLATFSPRGLIEGGFGPFIATLRATMRHVGGLRIDHAMGLERLWLVPAGASPAEGAYLCYPQADLMRLIALESHRHRAVVIGEDLGTVPAGFRGKLARAGIFGMRVLWFERDGERFRPPDRWERRAVAMSSTHDLPTVAGWWRGRDIEWRARLDLLAGDGAEAAERALRNADRQHLWQALIAAGVAELPVPPPEAADRVVEPVLRFVAAAPSAMALLPLEDLLGEVEQPNLPGTVDEHPNWRRRFARPAADMLDAPEVRFRLAAVAAARRCR